MTSPAPSALHSLARFGLALSLAALGLARAARAEAPGDTAPSLARESAPSSPAGPRPPPGGASGAECTLIKLTTDFGAFTDPSGGIFGYGTRSVSPDIVIAGGDDHFFLELYGASDGMHPLKPGTFDLAAPPDDNYATCAHCIRLFALDASGKRVKQFFQESGTLNLFKVKDPLTDDVQGYVTHLKLVEVTIGPDSTSTPVPGGECLTLAADGFGKGTTQGNTGLSFCMGTNGTLYCGVQAPAWCFCDHYCPLFGDCCPDYNEVCSGANDAGSCAADDGTLYCGNFSPYGCWCDELCLHYEDCCPDKKATCGGLGRADGSGDAGR